MTSKTARNPGLRYDEGCLAAHALNAVGDRWALLVVRELMLRPKRFQAIRAGLPGITAGVLAQRLSQLDGSGVVQHEAEFGAYALTASGRELRAGADRAVPLGQPAPRPRSAPLHQPDGPDALDGRQHRSGGRARLGRSPACSRTRDLHPPSGRARRARSGRRDSMPSGTSPWPATATRWPAPPTAPGRSPSWSTPVWSRWTATRPRAGLHRPVPAAPGDPAPSPGSAAGMAAGHATVARP